MLPLVHNQQPAPLMPGIPGNSKWQLNVSFELTSMFYSVVSVSNLVYILRHVSG